MNSISTNVWNCARVRQTRIKTLGPVKRIIEMKIHDFYSLIVQS